MRLISLFSGAGGFDLGFQQEGFSSIGMCEIDEKALSVLNRHWPKVPKHRDIRTLSGAAFGEAEVVVWGSPCQDLSTAGERRGLAGNRSGLFHHGMRFMEELREATNGDYPRISIWENVQGALNSNAGRDFAVVLAAFIGQAEVPMPQSGKWARSGVVRGHGRSVAWRVLDSQYFGLAQRRRRLFVVTDFRGYSAEQILFEREGLCRDSTKSGETKESAAVGVGKGDGRYDKEGKSFLPKVIGGFNWQAGERETMSVTDPTPPLRAQTTGHMAVAYSLGPSYAVRRLLPVETERLQGFADDWTRYDADGVELADSHRYRMSGNAVSVPVARWLASRVKEVLT